VKIRRWLRVVACAWWLGVAGAAAAQEAAGELPSPLQPGPLRDEPEPARRRPPHDPEATILDIRDLRSFGIFAAGALTGFFAHEAGHVFVNLILGNVPTIQPIWGFGFIPFFAIAPNIDCGNKHHCVRDDGSAFSPGWRGKVAITSAGFNVQHITDEIMLTRNPTLRHQVAPYRKGLLAFNTLLSLGYATAAIARIENPEGDISSTAALMGIPRELYASMLVIPAAMDIYRYFVPDSRWAPWVSRSGKLAVFGVMFVVQN
jgi:hypothetical protein